jgi:hypothetical protein
VLFLPLDPGWEKSGSGIIIPDHVSKSIVKIGIIIPDHVSKSLVKNVLGLINNTVILCCGSGIQDSVFFYQG